MFKQCLKIFDYFFSRYFANIIMNHSIKLMWDWRSGKEMLENPVIYIKPNPVNLGKLSNVILNLDYNVWTCKLTI